ncbi:cytochrome P450 [Artomyces pyxidatus]|uniref:Cytochrome P450 n=1 Tax=Artomyces pyxidatus TaxID=48021 RepID=A0ACB8SKX9_9AGAM|nr:cytochrome P450 [Artomyces pyxidatus]
MPVIDVAVYLLICFGLFKVVSQLVNAAWSHNLPIPPRPNRLPIIGNVLSIPKHAAWKAYAEWSRRENSDLVGIQILGQLSIVVNTKKAAQELFERRSSVYADRPQLAMNVLTGWDFTTAFTAYSDEWRAQRKIFHQSLNARAATTHHPVQLEKVELLVKCLHDEPDDFARHMRRYAASIAMVIAYGYNTETNDDHFVDVAKKASHASSSPTVRYLPDWFPGAGFKIRAKECMALIAEMQEGPIAYVKRSMRERTRHPYHYERVVQTVCRAILHNPDDYPDPESFKPERFLTAEGNINEDEVQVAFGLGRRNCVGMHMANATLWIMMASLLAIFDISKAKDEGGNEIPVDIAYTDNLVSTSLPFRCAIRPRDREAEELIQQIGHSKN